MNYPPWSLTFNEVCTGYVMQGNCHCMWSYISTWFLFKVQTLIKQGQSFIPVAYIKNLQV